MKLLYYDVDDHKYDTDVRQVCKHSSVMPPFDIKAASGMSSYEIRKRWPRFCGVCPDCECNVILYASFVHYVAGDW